MSQMREAQEAIVKIDGVISNGLKLPVISFEGYKNLLKKRSAIVVAIQKKGY